MGVIWTVKSNANLIIKSHNISNNDNVKQVAPIGPSAGPGSPVGSL